MRFMSANRGPFSLIELLQWLIVLAVLFVLMGTTFGADDKLKLPETVKAQPCKLVRIQAETKGKKVIWIVPAQFEADALEGTKLVGVVAAPGTYRILAITSIEDEPIVAETTLIVEGLAPIPPEDSLKKELQTLYTADANPKKAEQIKWLADVYRAAVAFTADREIVTADRLAAMVRTARQSKIPDTDLKTIRDRITVEVSALLPTEEGTPMTPEIRSKAAQIYARIATALEAIK